MFNKYIALSALACAAILPLSAQAKSNSADADVNITLVDPIAISYQANSGSLGSVLIPDSGSVGYQASFLNLTAPSTTFTVSGSPVVLAAPTSFDYTVSGGVGLGYSLTASVADTDANDGVTINGSFMMCENASAIRVTTTRDNGTSLSGSCFIQEGVTKVRLGPRVTVASTAEAAVNTKVATLTVAVAYE